MKIVKEQKGICAEPNLHAQYLLLNVLDDDAQAVRAKLARIVEVFDYYEHEYYEAMATGLIAVGTSYWPELYPGLLPLELAPFPDIAHEDRCAPALPYDMFIQIRADRLDICHTIAMEVMELLRPHVELIEQEQGFRYLDGRDLNGFIHADDNPRGNKRKQIAIIGDEDPDFAGGSYIHIQRYRHDLRRWQQLPESKQEEIMGVSKQHNLPLADVSDDAHSVRSATQRPHSDDATLLKQGMPYGDMLKQGLFFVSCSASNEPFKRMLYSQVVGTEDGAYDRWLDYTSAETGAAFFAPSVTFIIERAND